MSMSVEETNGAYDLKKRETYNLEKLRGRWPLKKNIITIGRDASNDIILPQALNYVPRHGCEFLKRGKNWIYISSEGLAQNLRNGDEISIGGIILRFQEKA